MGHGSAAYGVPKGRPGRQTAEAPRRPVQQGDCLDGRTGIDGLKDDRATTSPSAGVDVGGIQAPESDAASFA